MELKELYELIIHVVNKYLKNTSTLTFEELKNFDPTVEQIATDMRVIATLLKDLAGDNYDDTNMATNAFQCCIIMEQLADAVATDDNSILDELISQLKLHTKVP